MLSDKMMFCQTYACWIQYINRSVKTCITHYGFLLWHFISLNWHQNWWILVCACALKWALVLFFALVYMMRCALNKNHEYYRSIDQDQLKCSHLFWSLSLWVHSNFFFLWKWHSFRWCHSDQESQEHIRMIHRSRHSIYSNLMIVVNKNRVTNAACVFFTPVSVFACESFSSHFFPRHVARGVLRLFFFLLAASFTFDPSSKWSNQIGHYNWPNTKIG